MGKKKSAKKNIFFLYLEGTREKYILSVVQLSNFNMVGLGAFQRYLPKSLIQ